MSDFPPPLSTVRSSGKATASLICGLAGLLACLPAIPAVILGHLASTEVRKSGGTITGSGKATAGLILGYIGIVGMFLIPVLAGIMAPLVIRQKLKADHVQCIHNVRQLGEALTVYSQGGPDGPRPLPGDLMTLEKEGFTTNVSALLTMRATHGGDWVYFPGAKLEDPGATVLISPAIGEKHVVLKMDNSVTSVYAAQALALRDAATAPAVNIPAPTAR